MKTGTISLMKKWLMKHWLLAVLIILLFVVPICLLHFIDSERRQVNTSLNIQRIKKHLLYFYEDNNKFPSDLKKLKLPNDYLKSGWGREIKYNAEGHIVTLKVDYGDSYPVVVTIIAE